MIQIPSLEPSQHALFSHSEHANTIVVHIATVRTKSRETRFATPIAPGGSCFGGGFSGVFEDDFD
jgi:hypothetical protein